MDAVTAMRAVLVADASLISLVPAVRIQAGVMPQGTPLPAVILQSISRQDNNIPAPGITRFVWERVQVTVLAANYPQQKAVLAAVRRAAADVLYPAVPGISGVTIHTDGAGPDMSNDDASIFIGSQDFRVKYQEER